MIQKMRCRKIKISIRRTFEFDWKTLVQHFKAKKSIVLSKQGKKWKKTVKIQNYFYDKFAWKLAGSRVISQLFQKGKKVNNGSIMFLFFSPFFSK